MIWRQLIQDTGDLLCDQRTRLQLQFKNKENRLVSLHVDFDSSFFSSCRPPQTTKSFFLSFFLYKMKYIYDKLSWISEVNHQVLVS